MKDRVYQPPKETYWKGVRASPQPNPIYSVIKCLDLSHGSILKEDLPTFAFIGFACDAGIKQNHERPGAVLGPIALRKALGKFSAPQNCVLYDAGEVLCEDGHIEASQSYLAKMILNLQSQGIHPIVMGGDSSLVLGHYRGILERDPEMDCGVISFDSRVNFKDFSEKQLNGNFACIGVQKRPNEGKNPIKVVTAKEIHLRGIDNGLEFLDEFTHKHVLLYITINLRVFAAAFAPGVSAPEALGIYPWQIIPLIEKLASTGKVIGFDIVDLSPPFDIDDHTSNLAASLIVAYLNAFLAPQAK